MSEIKRSYICDEDEGCAVGVLLDLPNGDQVWSGEVADSTFAEQDEETLAMLGPEPAGEFVIHASKGEVRVLARCASIDDAMALAIGYAEALARTTK